MICEECCKDILISFKKDNYAEKNFKKHIYIAKYDAKLREVFLKYKFNDKSYLYRFFTEIILNTEEVYSFLKNYDIIIPVPIHKSRKLERGYNQSELIAKSISKKVNIQYCNVLVKSKGNFAQSKLNKEQREQNVKNVYNVKKMEKILNKNIVLFDDIYTTGATVNECSKILINAGANNVDVFTIFKD